LPLVGALFEVKVKVVLPGGLPIEDDDNKLIEDDDKLPVMPVVGELPASGEAVKATPVMPATGRQLTLIVMVSLASILTVVRPLAEFAEQLALTSVSSVFPQATRATKKSQTYLTKDIP